jgi:predicted transcriptional regulator
MHAASPRAAFDRIIPMPQSAKKLLRETLDKLPDDATVEEAIERLLFLAKIEQGIAEADAGRTLSHEEARARLDL